MNWAVCYEKAIRDDGSLLFPERLTEEFLTQARRTMGSYLFANQYQNEIIPEGEKKFKKEWIRYYTQLPERLFHFAFIDPAIGQEKVHDYTALVVVAVDMEKNWYVRHASRQRITPTQIIQLCFDVHTKWSPQAIGIESVAFQQALASFAHEEAKRRGINLPITAVPRSGQKTKEMRILSLVPRFEWGSLFLAGNQHDLEQELAQFPRGAHDDICFVAGTKVLCASGEKNIQDIVVGDWVVTPVGLDQVTHTSSHVAPVMEFGPLTGTHNHPVWTWNGLKRLDALACIDDVSYFTCRELIRWASLRSWSSMESGLSGWAARDFITYLNTQRTKTGGPKRLGFTSLFISTIREKKFRKAFTFTILTAIHSITATRIWSAYRLRTTPNTLVEINRRWLGTSIEFVHLLSNGTLPQKAENFTEKLRNVLGKQRSCLNSLASYAANSLKHLFPLEPTLALFPVSKSLDIKTNPSLYLQNVISVTQTSRNESGAKPRPVQSNADKNSIHAPVYNLRTEKHHLFYANGILVSNCDALASIEDIVYYPSQLRRRNEQPSPNDPGYEKWFRENLLRRAGAKEEDFR